MPDPLVAGIEMTAADVLPDDELAEYVLKQRGKASDVALRGDEGDIGEPPWL